jgi:hypothetical protein
MYMVEDSAADECEPGSVIAAAGEMVVKLVSPSSCCTTHFANDT